jgi:hypothetical protein
VTVDGLGDPTHFHHARSLSTEWPTPIRYVPGNHDIGDNPPGSWLAATAAEAGDRPVALVLHRPLFQDSPLDEKPHHRYLPLASRRRLLDLLSGVALRAVLSGHTHQYRDRTVPAVRHVWLPSTAFYLPDELQERLGEKVTGLGVLDLTPDGLRFHLVCPEGVVRNSVLDHPVYPELGRARLATR